MNCPHCKKEIDNDSKFCEFCGKKIASRKDYGKILDEILKKEESTKKRKTIYSTIKKITLVLSILVVTTSLVSLQYELAGESLVISIPATILIVFVYKKLEKKFNL